MEKKIAAIRELFQNCNAPEERYKKIIEIGRSAPLLEAQYCNADHRVEGCQSTLYLHAWVEDGKIYFQAQSDALISNGLAQLLTRVYSGERPETVLQAPPTYLEDLQIPASLSPTRSGGLSSLLLRMKQEALKVITANR